jgi:SNF2 family DNA or RNA helicase
VSSRYGKIVLGQDKGGKAVWTLEGQPHIMMAFKRMFAQSNRAAHGTIQVYDNDQVRRDLDWFLYRHELEISSEDRKAIDKGARRHHDLIVTLEKMIDPSYKPLEVRMAIPPREYQKVGASVALKKGSLLVADDVGLGKTCLALCTLSVGWTLPAAIVTLAGAMPTQWQDETAKFMPQLHAHVLKKGTPYELPKKDGRGPDVVVLNYHKLSGWDNVLKKYCRSVIFDECQELRHTGSEKYDAAKNLAEAMKFRLGLSATPIFNFGGEIYNVIEILSPDSLGSREEFHREWCYGSYRTDPVVKDPKALGSFLRENFLMLRRTRKEVGRELPPLQKIPQRIECDESALDQVKDSAAALAKIILCARPKLDPEEVRPAADGMPNIMQAGGQLSVMLRQATGISKAPYIADFLRLLVDSGEKVVCFLFHRAVYDVVMAKLEDLKPAMYSGTETPAEKVEARRRFVEGDTDVLLMSLRAGAGLDGLQKVCRTVVIGELDWAPAIHEQNIGRVFRDGQTEPVTAYFLVADDGADPLIAEKLGLKRMQAEGIRNPDHEILEEYQVDQGRAVELARRFVEKYRIEIPSPVGETA